MAETGQPAPNTSATQVDKDYLKTIPGILKIAEAVSHYSDVIMSTASQFTGIWIVRSIADQRKHKSFASLAFVRGIHRWLVDSSRKEPVTWKMFPFDDVIMSCQLSIQHWPVVLVTRVTAICSDKILGRGLGIELTKDSPWLVRQQAIGCIAVCHHWFGIDLN